jgi:hypothetical protein
MDTARTIRMAHRFCNRIPPTTRTPIRRTTQEIAIPPIAEAAAESATQVQRLRDDSDVAVKLIIIYGHFLREILLLGRAKDVETI